MTYDNESDMNVAQRRSEDEKDTTVVGEKAPSSE